MDGIRRDRINWIIGKNGHVVGKYNGVMFEAIPDKSDSDNYWVWVPLNR